MKLMVGFRTIGMYLRYPKVLHLEITNRCNAKCPMCRRTWMDPAPADLPFSVIQDRFAEHKFDLIKYCGSNGDPLMAKDFLDFARFFSTRAKEQLIHTNGCLRNKKFWKDLAKIPNVKVSWGIDGTDQETHALYRVDTFLDRILENAKIFNDAGGISQWSFIKFRHNQYQVNGAKQLAYHYGFKEFEVIETRRFGFNNENVFTYERDGVTINLERPDGNDIGMKNGTEITCKAQKQEEVYIDASGLVWACTYMADDEEPRNHEAYYNIHNTSFHDIIYGEYFDSIVSSWKKDPCDACLLNCKHSWSNKHEIYDL